MKKDKNIHLDVYPSYSVFYNNGNTTVFHEGQQSEAARKRYSFVTECLEKGYLEEMYANCVSFDTHKLDAHFKQLLEELVSSITSEAGRALAGLAFLQITIKSIVPEQSIRLHKGRARKGGFSWTEGISMRTIDSNYNTPFLKEKGLLNVNKYGNMMTRSLAENYPYSRLYKAEMKGAFHTWIEIVDFLENGKLDYKAALAYMISLLINKSNHFKLIADEAIVKAGHYKGTLSSVQSLLVSFFNSTRYSARAFEVVIHGFMQAYTQNGYTDLELAELSQMRSANKKHGNVGDIELRAGSRIEEAWDAKYGKTYLYDELLELKDKLEANPGVALAGFITNDALDLKPEIIERKNDVEMLTDTDVKLLTFAEWINYKTRLIPSSERSQFAKEWLMAVVETFARKRLEIAPIDEPCEGWLKDLCSFL